MLCIPLHCRGRAGEYRFSALSGRKCSKTCTPPRPRPSNPQPCLLLLRRSNECRFPSHHTKTAHALYSPALPRARGGSTGFQHFQAPNVPKPVLPRVRGPATPNPAYCFSEEATNVGFLPTIQTQHMLCIPLHCRGCGGVQVFRLPHVPKPKPVLPRVRGPAPTTLLCCFSEEATNVGFLPTITCSVFPCIAAGAGEYRFSALSGPKCSRTCTPPRSRPSTPNPACCFSEEATNVGFLPTIQRQHMLCIPLHCRGRAGSTGFQHFQAPNVPKPVLPRVRGPAPPTLLIASPKK